VLQKPGSWSDIRMMLRHAHLAPEHLLAYSGNINGARAISATLLAALEKKLHELETKNPCESLTHKGLNILRLRASKIAPGAFVERLLRRVLI
jgi:hypothetical protein